uniref:Uncharacterized protein n=1 Tax=Anguilla anguilla TaxID=7936 RepID=A0A0E9RK32_ANGAN
MPALNSLFIYRRTSGLPRDLSGTNHGFLTRIYSLAGRGVMLYLFTGSTKTRAQRRLRIISSQRKEK